MAYKGKVIHNAYTGEVIKFLETAADTGGRQLKIQWKIISNKVNCNEHVHENHDEYFEIITGNMHYSIQGKESIAIPGEVIFFPRGVRHQHFITLNDPVVFIYTATPALDMEYIIESISYKTINTKLKKGMPSFLQGTVWFESTKAKVYDASVPVFIQKIVSLVLLPIGKILGYRSIHY